MLFAGLDLSRKRLDVCVLDAERRPVLQTAAPPDLDGLRGLVARLAPLGPIEAAIESMNGARFVHDQLERRAGRSRSPTRRRSRGWPRWPARPTGSTPGCWPSCRAGTWCRRSGCPTPTVRAERERARWRLHLVRHRTALKNRIHATLLAFGHPCPVSDLFGAAGASCWHRLDVARAVARQRARRGLRLIDELDRQIAGCERELRRWAPTTATSRC